MSTLKPIHGNKLQREKIVFVTTLPFLREPTFSTWSAKLEEEAEEGEQGEEAEEGEQKVVYRSESMSHHHTTTLSRTNT